jgi:hypothetical protein
MKAALLIALFLNVHLSRAQNSLLDEHSNRARLFNKDGKLFIISRFKSEFHFQVFKVCVFKHIL